MHAGKRKSESNPVYLEWISHRCLLHVFIFLSIHFLSSSEVCVCVCLPEQEEGKIKSKEHPADKKLFEASEDSTLVASACLYTASQRQTKDC